MKGKPGKRRARWMAERESGSFWSLSFHFLPCFCFRQQNQDLLDSRFCSVIVSLSFRSCICLPSDSCWHLSYIFSPSHAYHFSVNSLHSSPIGWEWEIGIQVQAGMQFELEIHVSNLFDFHALLFSFHIFLSLDYQSYIYVYQFLCLQYIWKEGREICQVLSKFLLETLSHCLYKKRKDRITIRTNHSVLILVSNVEIHFTFPFSFRSVTHNTNIPPAPKSFSPQRVFKFHSITLSYFFWLTLHGWNSTRLGIHLNGSDAVPHVVVWFMQRFTLS